jgi:Ser/Thr protein kinase RdoA (MazF antagonist)
MSTSNTAEPLVDIAHRFAIEGAPEQIQRYGSGHINDTYLVQCRDGCQRFYILQRLNPRVFLRADAVMRNIERVTRHLRSKQQNSGDRCVLSLVPTITSESHTLDLNGATWRMYSFVEGTVSYDEPPNAEVAREVAKAFGEFQRDLLDLPPDSLFEPLPDFHHTRKRFDALLEAVAEDRAGRLAHCRDEVRFIMERERDTSVLTSLAESGTVPTHVTHNDTKINNVLLDMTTGKHKCVIDLDTVMPGLTLYDFGDLVRTATCTAAEDEDDLSRVTIDLNLFRAVTEGYVEAIGMCLSDVERDHLVFAGKLITLETAIRFLTDHLNGDRYFKIHRPNHNLDRCRAQLRLVEEIERNQAEMERIAQAALRDMRTADLR